MSPGGASAGTGPAAWLDPSVLAGLSNLELVARTVVDGFVNGLHRSVRPGFSLEFADYRPYTPGDDPRFIDWNAYARTGRTYLKRYLGETTTHLMLLLDASASMGFERRGLAKLRYAKFLAASLAWLASRQHDAVGLIVYDEQVREHLPPSTRTGHLRRLLHGIDAATSRAGTDVDGALDRFRWRVSRRGLVAVISDFYCEPDALLASVRPLAYRGQDVVLFHVLDPDEIEPELERSSLLVDVETGHRMEVASEFAQGDYPTRMRAHIDRLSRAAGELGADHVLLDTAKPLDAALRAYLAFRQHRG